MTTLVDVLDGTLTWYRVVDSGHPAEGDRLHARIAGRYITIFRHKGVLSAIDALCHHAGGPLTLGKVVDIEDLGVTVVQCPWHKWSVTIDTGMKAYQGVEIKNGKPCPTGWRMGKLVQRAHKVVEHEDGIYVVSSPMKMREYFFLRRYLHPIPFLPIYSH